MLDGGTDVSGGPAGRGKRGLKTKPWGGGRGSRLHQAGRAWSASGVTEASSEL